MPAGPLPQKPGHGERWQMERIRNRHERPSPLSSPVSEPLKSPRGPSNLPGDSSLLANKRTKGSLGGQGHCPSSRGQGIHRAQTQSDLAELVKEVFAFKTLKSDLFPSPCQRNIILGRLLRFCCHPGSHHFGQIDPQFAIPVFLTNILV